MKAKNREELIIQLQVVVLLFPIHITRWSLLNYLYKKDRLMRQRCKECYTSAESTALSEKIGYLNSTGQSRG